MTTILTQTEYNDITNLINANKLLTKMDNPNPITIVVIVIVIMILFYFTYVVLIKQNLSGQWFDENNKVFLINHCGVRDVIKISRKNDIQNGIVKGNVVILFNKDNTKTGIYINDCIKWTDDTMWKKIKI